MNDTADDKNEMLCGCSNITVGQFYDLIAANPKDFDEVLRETGAGQTCTACLLDLEYHYVRAFEASAPRTSGGKVLKKAKKDSSSLKRRIYRFIDALAPLVPIKLRQVTPVLYGAGVTEWLCVSNDSLMYEGEVAAPPFRLDIVLRDSEGRIVLEQREIVPVGEALRMDISAPLLQADKSSNGDLKLGWMDLLRRAQTPGVRGTTRPQIELVTSAGVCAVHTQAATERSQSGLTLRLRPGEDRHFLTVVNAEPKPLAFRLAVETARLPEPIRLPIDVPAWGARLVEIPIPSVQPDGELGILTDVSWTTDRMNKVYILCATPNLDRFSVDHA